MPSKLYSFSNTFKIHLKLPQWNINFETIPQRKIWKNLPWDQFRRTSWCCLQDCFLSYWTNSDSFQSRLKQWFKRWDDQSISFKRIHESWSERAHLKRNRKKNKSWSRSSHNNFSRKNHSINPHRLNAKKNHLLWPKKHKVHSVLFPWHYWACPWIWKACWNY